MKQKIKNSNYQRGFFDEDLRLEKLTAKGDPLIALDKFIPWNDLVKIINKGLKKIPKGPGGRPPYDKLLLFKMLLLQRYYNLSFAQVEYQVMDRLSFMRFLGLNLGDDIPDQNTLWAFAEDLKEYNLVEKLFNRFNKLLEKEGVIGSEGTMIDASFVEAPKQRNSRDENKDIKSGKTPADWEKRENKNKLSQKDTDARWTKKNQETHYGYKNHIKADVKSKLILKYSVTEASMHDSQALGDLLDKSDRYKKLYADSAYTGENQENIMNKFKIQNKVCEKGGRNHPLSDLQKASNKKKSKIRARVEHIFGFVENSMNGSKIRSIGQERANVHVGLMNLVYNMFRSKQLQRA